MKQRFYIAIDLKSFYASVECRERGLDPLDTNLVVADESRTDKTICLAVTPSLKTYGISGRARLFEVIQQVREANRGRLHDAPGHRFSGKSCFLSELNATPGLEIDYLIAPPRMAYYMEYSTRIYNIYLKYIAPEDIIVYSIDEVFMDVTDYLSTYKLSPRELAMKIILDVIETTGITATRALAPICISVKLQWTLWRSTSLRTKMVYALPNWTRCDIEKPCGHTSPSPTFGVLGVAMQESWNPMECSQWVMWRGCQKPMRICCISYSEKTQNFSLTMPGAGSHVPSRQLRRIVPLTAVLVPARFCIAHIQRRRLAWF